MDMGDPFRVRDPQTFFQVLRFQVAEQILAVAAEAETAGLE